MPQDYSQIEKLLLQEPGIIAIVRDPFFKLPNIDYKDLFEFRSREEAMEAVETMVNLNNGPYIQDIFESDTIARNLWNRQMAEKYPGFWEYRFTDALKRNNWKAMISSLRDMKYYAGYKGPGSEAYYNMLESGIRSEIAAEEYDKLASSGKITYVRGLRQSTQKIITFLASNSLRK